MVLVMLDLLLLVIWGVDDSEEVTIVLVVAVMESVLENQVKFIMVRIKVNCKKRKKKML